MSSTLLEEKIQFSLYILQLCS